MEGRITEPLIHHCRRVAGFLGTKSFPPSESQNIYVHPA